jgi:hypothetical protein
VTADVGILALRRLKKISGKNGDSMKALPLALSGILLSLVATSARADIIISPTPAGTGNNVVTFQDAKLVCLLGESVIRQLPELDAGL